MPPETLLWAPKNFDAPPVLQIPRTTTIEWGEKLWIRHISMALGVNEKYLKTIFAPVALDLEPHVWETFIFWSSERKWDVYTLIQEGTLTYLERIRNGLKTKKEIPQTFIYPDTVKLPEIFSHYTVRRKKRGSYEITFPNGTTKTLSQEDFYQRILPEMRNKQELFNFRCQTRFSLAALSKACSANWEWFKMFDPQSEQYTVSSFIPNWNLNKNPPATVVARGD